MTQVDMAPAMGMPLDSEPTGPGRVAMKATSTHPAPDRWVSFRGETPDVGAPVLDGQGQIAEYRGMEGPYAYLRPVGGGREYEVLPERITPTGGTGGRV